MRQEREHGLMQAVLEDPGLLQRDGWREVVELPVAVERAR